MRFGPVLLLAGLLAAQAQPAAQEQDKCRVEGKVLNSATAQPVARAWVTLHANSGAFTAATDAGGNFVFTGLAAGAYWIEAKRDNFMYNSPQSLTLTAGEEKKDVALQITPFGAIAGRVRDPEGDPISDLQVSAMVYEYSASGRRLVSRGSVQTNDLGEYRLHGLLAGKYFLRTAPSQAPKSDETYLPTYYPGVTDPYAAARLDLGAGQELPGNDFTIRRTRTVAVRGRVVSPAGATQTGVSMSASGMSAANSNVDEQGAFKLYGVAPGAYTLSATARVGEKFYGVRRPVQVGADDIEGIELRLAPPVDLNGVVRIEGSTGIKPSQVSLGLGPWGARPKDDGTFAFRDVTPDIYRPTFTLPDDLFVKGMRCGNTDVAESGLDLTGGGGCDLVVTLSANGAQIEGRVENENGQPAKSATVTLAAEGARHTDLFKETATDASGHFKIVGVAPGSYRLYAWEPPVDFNAVRYDPDFVKPFESLSRSLQITEGARESVSLKRIPKPAGQ